jgi:hypothetical protein
MLHKPREGVYFLTGERRAHVDGRKLGPDGVESLGSSRPTGNGRIMIAFQCISISDQCLPSGIKKRYCPNGRAVAQSVESRGVIKIGCKYLQVADRLPQGEPGTGKLSAHCANPALSISGSLAHLGT